MNVLMLSSKLLPKRVAIAVLVFTVTVIGASVQSHAADGFWRSNLFRSNVHQATPHHSSARTPAPRTGYSSNLHRNFVIRQQQQRTQSGGTVVHRGNVFWRR